MRMSKRKFQYLQKERMLFDIILLGLCLSFCEDDDDDLSDDAMLDLVFMTLVELEKTRTARCVVPSKRHCASISQFSPEECWSLFRFRKQDLPRLKSSLLIPDELELGQAGHHSIFSGEEGLLLLLRRLAYPNRATDLVELFGLYPCEISLLLGHMVFHVYDNFHNLLENSLEMWIPSLPKFRDVIVGQGAPVGLNIWCFLDGTLRPMCRPSYGQRSQYSGHKRVHGLKFEILSLPNGIIARLYGPEDGRRHDITMARNSGLYGALELIQNAGQDVWGERFRCFADSGYIGLLNDALIIGFKGAHLTQDQQAFNTCMSRVRESVEWTFGKVVVYFAFLDFKKNLKAFLQPIAVYYIVGALLTNCHTCFYGSETSDFFDCAPPDLEEYLNSNAQQ